jgi:hypothetical protein
MRAGRFGLGVGQSSGPFSTRRSDNCPRMTRCSTGRCRQGVRSACCRRYGSIARGRCVLPIGGQSGCLRQMQGAENGYAGLRRAARAPAVPDATISNPDPSSGTAYRGACSVRTTRHRPIRKGGDKWRMGCMQYTKSNVSWGVAFCNCMHMNSAISSVVCLKQRIKDRARNGALMGRIAHFSWVQGEVSESRRDPVYSSACPANLLC